MLIVACQYQNVLLNLVTCCRMQASRLFWLLWPTVLSTEKLLYVRSSVLLWKAQTTAHWQITFNILTTYPMQDRRIRVTSKDCNLKYMQNFGGLICVIITFICPKDWTIPPLHLWVAHSTSVFLVQGHGGMDRDKIMAVLTVSALPPQFHAQLNFKVYSEFYGQPVPRSQYRRNMISTYLLSAVFSISWRVFRDLVGQPDYSKLIIITHISF